MRASLLLDAHDAIQEICRCLKGGSLGRRCGECGASCRETGLLPGCGQEAVMADALEALGQHMQQETAGDR